MNVALGLLVDWEEGRRGGGKEGERVTLAQLVEHCSRQCPSTSICSYNFMAKTKDFNIFPTALKHRL